MSAPQWTYSEEYKTWEWLSRGVFASIQPRPHYCDRGHWIARVSGLGDIDNSDAFPRYYMDLERAKVEMSEWLEWRLSQNQQGAYERYAGKATAIADLAMHIAALHGLELLQPQELQTLSELLAKLTLRITISAAKERP